MNENLRHIIYPGQYMVAGGASSIRTVLGSCVAVCLWDRTLQMGGMNHYLLPGKESEEEEDANRGRTAIPLLVRAMLDKSAKLGNIEAKVFGGCNSLYRNDDIFRVGERNIEMAFRVLNEFGIPLAARDVGGMYGREIIFNVSTGKVRMKLLVNGNELNEANNKGLSN